MADSIVSFLQIKDADNNVVQYDVSYTVVHASLENNFCVVVKAEEMTLATDVAEAKTKANVKAAAIKTAWVAALPAPTQTSQDAQLGNVTLS